MRSYKILWIVIAVILLIGIILSVTGTAMGATAVIKNFDGITDNADEFFERYIFKNIRHKEHIGTKDISEESYTADTTDIKKLNITLDRYEIALLPTSKDEINISPPDTLKITEDADIMTVEGKNTDEATRKVKIYIPRNLCPEVIVETGDCAISIEELKLASLTCSIQGTVSLEDVRCDADIELSGDFVNLEDVTAENIIVKTDAGRVSFDSLHFDTMLDITNLNGIITGELEGRRNDYTLTLTDSNGTTVEGDGAKTVNVTSDTAKVNITYDD